MNAGRGTVRRSPDALPDDQDPEGGRRAGPGFLFLILYGHPLARLEGGRHRGLRANLGLGGNLKDMVE